MFIRKIGRYKDVTALNLRGIVPDDFAGYVTVEVVNQSENEILLKITRIGVKGK